MGPYTYYSITPGASITLRDGLTTVTGWAEGPLFKLRVLGTTGYTDATCPMGQIATFALDRYRFQYNSVTSTLTVLGEMEDGATAKVASAASTPEETQLRQHAHQSEFVRAVEEGIFSAGSQAGEGRQRDAGDTFAVCITGPNSARCADLAQRALAVVAAHFGVRGEHLTTAVSNGQVAYVVQYRLDGHGADVIRAPEFSELPSTE